MSSSTPTLLKPEQLFRATDVNDIGAESSDQLEDIDAVAGQERATSAIEFAIGIDREGYNLYVAGPSGAGKRTLVDKLIRQHRREDHEIFDWCYVNNFDDPSRPRMFSLPSGRACGLKRDMEKLLERLLTAVPKAFRGDEYRHRISDIQEDYQQRETQLFSELNDHAREKNMVVIRTPSGYTIGPVRDGKMMTPAQFNQLPKPEQEAAKQEIDELNRRLRDLVEEMHSWQEESSERVKAVDEEFIHQLIDPMMATIKSRYQMYPQVIEFLNGAHQNIAENIWDFMPSEEETNNSVPTSKRIFAGEHLRYHVNVLVDNSATDGVPVLYEDNPTFQNVVGRIEHVAQMGTLLTNFTLIKPGALHRANGGFLVLDARKVLSNGFVWDALKRAIRSKEVRIESIDRILSLGSTISLEPESIPLNLKIILVGDRYLYHMLREYDPEFSLYFKVHADFNDTMDRSPESTALYARILASLARRDACRPLTAAGLCRMIDQSARDSADAEKLSLRMSELSNLLLESDYWAGRENSPQIDAAHVAAAVEHRELRNNRYQQLMAEQTEKGVLLIDTDGARCGQINGLAVLQIGEHSFGRPSRITATARLGSGKLVDIERETNLGGPLHSKGVMILSSFLANRYAPDQTLSLSASIVFEQSYGRVDGDSASMAELVALLSAIAEVPIKQCFAMTGSVNQFGEMQAIGGVNQKIEGFFDLCASRGLDGTHGVIIPASNFRHLMLKADVVEACKAGLFQVHAVDHVDQAITLLTGMKAGRALKGGGFSAASFNHKVVSRLEEFSKLARQRSGPAKAKSAARKKANTKARPRSQK